MFGCCHRGRSNSRKLSTFPSKPPPSLASTYIIFCNSTTSHPFLKCCFGVWLKIYTRHSTTVFLQLNQNILTIFPRMVKKLLVEFEFRFLDLSHRQICDSVLKSRIKRYISKMLCSAPRASLTRMLGYPIQSIRHRAANISLIKKQNR